MAYNPLQKRGPDGKWISTGAKKAVRRATRKKANKRAYQKSKIRYKRSEWRASLKIDKAASRQIRGTGITGAKRNFIPYVRVNKRSATVGANTGAFIPGSNRRVVVGAYTRLETTNKETKLDRIAGRAAKKLAPKGSKRAAIGKHLRKNVSMDKAAKLRYGSPLSSSTRGIEARLGTSRKGGPTLIVRKGQHKIAVADSVRGVKKYNTRMTTVQSKREKAKKKRPSRRKSANRRKK